MSPKLSLDKVFRRRNRGKFRRCNAIVKRAESDSTSPTAPGAPQCDEPPSSSSVEVPGAPHCDESPSSSAAASKKSIIENIRQDIDAIKRENVDVDVEKLMEHINQLLKQREEEKTSRKRSSTPRSFPFPWPPGWNKLKDILSLGTDLKKLQELLSGGLAFVSAVKDIISGPVKTLLKELGKVSVATAGLLVVAYALERFDEMSTNQEERWDLLKEMSDVASVVKILQERTKGMQNVIKEATAFIIEGAMMCCAQIDSPAWKSFLLASAHKEDLKGTTQKLLLMYSKINYQIGLRVLTAIESEGKSPLWKRYPKHAVGLEEPIKDVMKLLECECESEKNVVIVILHGFGGMGKTTLGDAVFSQVGGCKYSKVRLFENIDSTPPIIELQKQILNDLKNSKDTIPEIRTPEDGQDALEEMLEKVQAFIYIDNVLKSSELQRLLPKNMDKAKKVRFLLTARDVEDLSYACPTRPEIYQMKDIETSSAMSILKRTIGVEITDSEFNQIIEICDGSPLMLTLVASFIGNAGDKKKAYERLMQEKGKWEHKRFYAMRRLFALAYGAIPHNCKDPFMDICSFFKGWDWDTVKDIVGDEALESLESMALVRKDLNGLANVHDVILTLARQKSKEELKGKEVRLTFTRARELKMFLEREKDTRGIKGIWLSDDSDVRFHISASTLDAMSKSLRVLHLKNSTLVGNCSQIFSELVYFTANITHLPFDVSRSKQLRYLTYESNDLKLYENLQMPSSLRHINFFGPVRSSGHSHSCAFPISSTDLQQLRNLRILKLVNFRWLENLPEGLGDDLVNGLQELSLAGCESIETLPESISKFRFLRILDLDGCSRLIELPENLGSLNSLRELHLSGCSNLQGLPDSFEKLSSLTLLNLSFCRTLLKLPPGLGNLTSLDELNLTCCGNLKSIPESISELKLTGALEMSGCSFLKKLPCGICNLFSITSLSLDFCLMLKKLPDQFGQLASLRVLNLSVCWRLEKLPEGFGNLECLEDLGLHACYNLRELCNDFHCLSSLQNLDLSRCSSLDNLPEDFHCLPSLRLLTLTSCKKLEGKWMDKVVKMNSLQFLYIQESEQLAKRWEEILKDGGHRSESIAVISGQDHLSMSDGQREIIEYNLLSEFDRLLKNGQGKPCHVSDIPPNTDILVVFDHFPHGNLFPWNLIVDTIEELQINFKIIYIGPRFNWLPTKVKDRIFVVNLPSDRTSQMLENVFLTLDAGIPALGYRDSCYLQMRTKMDVQGDGKSDKYCPCWRRLTNSELEEFVVGNCRRYLQLKQLAETNRHSNTDFLRELFAPECEKTTHIFQKNSPSQQAPSTCGVDKLQGKTILLEIRPLGLSYNDIRLQSLKEMYDVVKKDDIEIISIPILISNESDVSLDTFNKFSREVPWLVLQNPWTVMTRVVKFFLAKQVGWEGDHECERWYPSVNWIIDSNGRITNKSSIVSMLDSGEAVKILYNHLQSVSYQVRWGAKASPFFHEKIEDLREEEWKQQKSMSSLDFLFNHLESVSEQVKKLMFQGNLICLLTGNDEELTCSTLEELSDVIPIIHIDKYQCEKFYLTDAIYKQYPCLSEKTTEMEGMTLQLSAHEAMRFWIRNVQLKEEINGMDESDEQLCDLKSILHSLRTFQPIGKREEDYRKETTSMIFIQDGQKIVATSTKETIDKEYRKDIKYRAKRLIKRMVKEYKEEGNQRHDGDSNISESLTKNMQTAAAEVEPENVDVYLDSLSEYISELLEVKQLYQLFKFNKELKKWSRPKATWPTSKGFCMLKNFLSDGKEVNWVKDVISSHPEQEVLETVIESLLNEIEEADCAAAGLLVVAYVLERSETISDYRDEFLFAVEEMFRLGQYIKQFNEKPGVWTQLKRAATLCIVAGSMGCCAIIDPPKFRTLFSEEDWGDFFSDHQEMFKEIQELCEKKCDLMAKAIAEGLVNEGGSLLKAFFETESEDQGGPSSAPDGTDDNDDVAPSLPSSSY